MRASHDEASVFGGRIVGFFGGSPVPVHFAFSHVDEQVVVLRSHVSSHCEFSPQICLHVLTLEVHSISQESPLHVCSHVGEEQTILLLQFSQIWVQLVLALHIISLHVVATHA